MGKMTAQQTLTKNNVVVETIDNILNQVFGREATLLIYMHLERNYSLKHDEIGDKIEVFARGLEDFLESSACIIERKILEDINSNCNLARRTELEDVNDKADFIRQMKPFMHRA